MAVDISLKKAEDYFEQKDYENVVLECQQVIQLNPREVDAYHLLGKALTWDVIFIIRRFFKVNTVASEL